MNIVKGENAEEGEDELRGGTYVGDASFNQDGDIFSPMVTVLQRLSRSRFQPGQIPGNIHFPVLTSEIAPNQIKSQR